MLETAIAKDTSAYLPKDATYFPPISSATTLTAITMAATTAAADAPRVQLLVINAVAGPGSLVRCDRRRAALLAAALLAGICRR